MNTSLAVALTLLILIVVGVAIWLAVVSRRRRRVRAHQEQVRQRTGPEFDRQAQTHGGMGAATARIEQRRSQLSPRELTPQERQRYSRDWTGIQNAFLDRPALALIEADRLVAQLMRDRGFHADDINDAALDLSLEHRSVVERFRSAHEILESGTTDIAQLRAAMLHYRTVVDDLLAVDIRGTQIREEPGGQTSL